MQYALVIGTDETISINKAERGLKCNCYCIECNGKLEAVQGEVKTWHFRHSVHNENCSGGRETVLHQRAKELLVRSSRLLSSRHGEISYTNAIAEKSLMSLRPDVTAEYNGEKIIFEIAVTHPIEKSKREHLCVEKLKCIEIDLKAWIHSEPNDEQLVHAVLNNPKNRVDLFWDDKAVIPLESQLIKPKLSQTPNEGTSWIEKGLFILGVVAVGKWLYNRFNPSRKKYPKNNPKSW